ncbi:MAG: hypothetical protein RMM58_02040 [Chloroflexota bacterium]|nr:hypothetical protein [Dehalococcoidia bacterium]MDW8252638.1 hypothetical protein [Chloroflexota bacterium]
MHEPPHELPSSQDATSTSEAPPPLDEALAPSPPPSPEPAAASRPAAAGSAHRGGPLPFIPPALGCLAVLCVMLGGGVGILWSGVGPRLVAGASGKPVVRVVKVAPIGPDGQYHSAASAFPADNRGMAGRVIYEWVPRGYRGEALVIWERVEGSGRATEIRPPDIVQVAESMTGTTWWYALRQPFPPGQYQFRLALVGPDGQRETVGAVRFEVRADAMTTPAGAATALPGQPGYRPPTRPPAIATQPGYRPPTRPPAITPPSQLPATATPPPQTPTASPSPSPRP